MFSGIITSVGKIVLFDRKKKIIAIESNFKKIFLGQSISCSGICLTVSKHTNNVFYCNLSEETVSKTNLFSKKVGDRLNLETSLKLGDEINGHLVFGHVDGVGKLSQIKELKGSNVLTFQVQKKIIDYLTPKCSIAIDGISLTVNQVLKRCFQISIIPYTWENTNLNNSLVGDKFNIEVDMLARYVHGALKK